LTNKEIKLYKKAFLATFFTKEVCGIPISYIYKAVVSNLKYKKEEKKAINIKLVALLEAKT
jgi:hypothetical protein